MARIANSTRHRGLATVEMALVGSLLMVLTLGAAEYGWMFWKIQQTNNAARNGARVGARAGATYTNAEQAVINTMTASGIASGKYHYTIPPTLATMPPGTAFRVQVQLDYGVAGGVRMFRGMALVPVLNTLSCEVWMVKEGP